MDFLVIAFMIVAVPFKVSKRNYYCLYSIERCLEYCNYYIDVLRGILAISSSINAMLLMMTFSYQYLPLFISQEARDDDGFPFRRITLRCHHWMSSSSSRRRWCFQWKIWQNSENLFTLMLIQNNLLWCLRK